MNTQKQSRNNPEFKKLIAQDILRKCEIRGQVRLHPYKKIVKDELLLDIVLKEMIEYNYVELDFDEDGYIIIILSGKDNETIDDSYNAILKDSTNEYMRHNYAGRSGRIYFENKLLWFAGRYDEVIFRTSLLQNYTIEDDEITFETLNNNYKFKILKKIELSSEILADKGLIEKTLAFDMRDYLCKY